MLKPLTLSLSLAVALSITSVSLAGVYGGGGCSTCGLASPQGAVVSPQAPIASAQCAAPCAAPCAPRKKCGLFGGMGGGLCKPKCFTYTWVLKKKRVWGCGGGGCGGCGVSTCGGVYPSAQGGYASPQGGYAAPQTYGTGQAYSAPAYGAGQASASTGNPAATVATAPTGDEAPPAPEAAPTAPAAPAPPAASEAPAPPANGPQSSLLFSTPSGN